ncbi:MAG: group II intron reverse transcriptase/maturase, partial [Bacteroidota bacterium]
MIEYKQQLVVLDKATYDQLCTSSQLRAAFIAVKKNKGAPGVDGITIEKFEENLDENIEQIRRELANWTYKPMPVRCVEIEKPSGGTRQLGIPTIRDRIVQAALKALLEPIFEPMFSENSYGFRPGRNQRQAVEAAQRIITTGKEYVVDIDLAKFFDKINHDKLIGRMGKHIEDKRILKIVGIILRSGIMKDGMVSETTEGSVQGSPLSPLLSNIVLDQLDKELEARGLEFCRYADDCNIFVKTEKAANRVMESIGKYIKNKLKLEINKEKSKVALSRFVKFLGMTIVAGTIAISVLSMNRAMAKVKELTPRGTSLNLETTIKAANCWYVGWANYYGMTQYPSQLFNIEAHMRRRCRSRIVDQQKSKRNLFEKLISRGVSRGLAAKAAYSN